MRSRIFSATMVFLVFSVLFTFNLTAFPAKEYRQITDLRGKTVTLPVKINRVVTIDDGLIEGIMTIIGESGKIVGLGSRSLRKTSGFTIPNMSGEDYLFKDCMNPVRYLNPGFADLPLIKNTTGVNFEALATLKPDVVIIRAGSCSASWGASSDAMEKTIHIIESLGIPVVALFAPPCFAEPNLDKIPEEIRLVGKIFEKEEKAARTADYIRKSVEMIKERTQGIPDEKKPRVLALGLSPKARTAGGAGNVRSGILKYYIEEIVHAKSAFTVKYHTPDTGLISTEHVFAIDPDIIVLTTSFGYHPPEEIYNAPYYQSLKTLSAVRNKKVSALPFTPSNCDASRIEHPIDLMVIAKSAYPDLFKDILVNEWVLEFYQNVYGVDLQTAKEIRTAQLLDWTSESNF